MSATWLFDFCSLSFEIGKYTYFIIGMEKYAEKNKIRSIV